MDENINKFEDENADRASDNGADIEMNDNLQVDVCDEDSGDAGMSVSVHAEELGITDAGSSFNIWKEIREWIFAIVFALVVVGLIKGFLFDLVLVDGVSMQTTLMDRDRLVLTKLGYTPQRGDIIVLDAHYKARQAYIAMQKEQKGENFGWFDEFKLRYIPWVQRRYGIEPYHYVKRVIALEGDVIDIDDATSTVLVNGVAVDEPYLNNVKTYRGYETKFPYTVDEGCIFVMGDNRENSRDSRYKSPGPIPYKAVLGKAAFRFWPFSAFGGVK